MPLDRRTLSDTPTRSGLTLFRRQELVLPTLWGWLLILTLLAVGTVLTGRNLYDFLSTNEALPVDGSPSPNQGTPLLIIEGWMNESELDQALDHYRLGHYQHVVTTGGPITTWHYEGSRNNYAERAADYLRAKGLRDVVAVVAPASAQERTFLSAVMVRDWADKQNLALNAVNVYSVGPHSRRTWRTYQLAFGPSVQMGIVAAVPREYDPTRWWTTSLGAKTVLNEAISWAWVTCCFWPPAPGTHEERWAVAPKTSRATPSRTVHLPS